MGFLYPGAIHIHSVHSDGTGTVEEIAKAAKKAGLSWIVITDHNNMEAKEGLYNGVCVLVGEEISPETENHYLALEIQTPVSYEMPATEFINQVKAQGGFGFIAHPDEKEGRKNSCKRLPWVDWGMRDFGGIEIWNYMSNWADSYNDSNAFHNIYSFFFRNKVSGPTKKTLDWWDNLNNGVEHIIPAIGGVDTHAFIIRRAFVTVKIFSYQNVFKKLTNFVYLANSLPDDFESRKKVILEAIRSGRNLIVNRALGSKKLVFCIENKLQKVHSGGLIKLDDCTNIIIELSRKADIRIIHNGNLILEKTAKKIRLPITAKGKYRIEAYYKKMPWIFSNPIIIE